MKTYNENEKFLVESSKCFRLKFKNMSERA